MPPARPHPASGSLFRVAPTPAPRSGARPPETCRKPTLRGVGLIAHLRGRIPASGAPAPRSSALPPWIVNFDDFHFTVARRAVPFHGIADPGADHRLGERRGPADPAGCHIRLVIANDAEEMLPAVFVDYVDSRPEMHFTLRLPRRVDDDGALELGVEIALIALD